MNELFGLDIAEHKRNTEEYYRERDGKKLEIRYTRGNDGELALSIYYKINMLTRKIGHTFEFAEPDGKKVGLNFGSKASRPYNFHMVPINPKCIEFMVIVNSKKVATLLGLATPEIMRKYSCRDYIWDDDAYFQGLKMGFYGYRFLIPPPKTRTELERIIRHPENYI
jgi:hypothetical protein